MPTVADTLFDRSMLNVLLGNYAAGNARALLNPFLQVIAQEYRRSTGARMIALDKQSMKQKLPDCDYFASRKIDGEFNILIVDGSSACLLNPGGTVRCGLGFLDEACQLISKAGYKRAVLAGELYVARDGRRARVHDVSRVARQPASVDEVASLRFAVFDIIELNQKLGPTRYAETWQTIEKICKGGKSVHPVETVRVKAVGDVEKLFAKWVETENAEGVVARSDTAGVFKIKPRCSIDVAVLGFTEGVDDRAGMLHDMLVGLVRSDETLHVLGRVGGGFTDDQRREYLSDLKDIAAESDYTEVNDAVAYQMVRPEWVIEMSCLDLINQNTRGASIERMVLHWDRGGSKYEIVRPLPLATPISPHFIRRRDDKRVSSTDLRIKQIADTIEVPFADIDARRATLPGSQMLKREVFTKSLKGQTIVRKLIMWKTNKDGDAGGGEWPAFVAYFTDFSPNRKTPLERDIRVSNSAEQIAQLYEFLKTENIVKGWVPA
jgi:hypothetical protein